MRTLRAPFVAMAAALAVSGTAGLVAVGCGDDTSGGAPDAGSDTTADSPEDTMGTETGPDTGPETAADSGSDTNTGVDASDAADSRVNDAADAADAPTIGQQAYAFANSVATAVCQRFFQCCGPLEAGTRDLPRCVANNVAYGWEQNLPANLNVYSRGNLTFDSARAAACLSAIANVPCGGAMQTAAAWSAVTQACELVIQGTVPNNQGGCIDSYECAPSGYCDPTVDGGLCRPLQGQGQPCNTVINAATPGQNPLADQMCSYLASSQSGLFCDLINNPPNAATCQPLLAAGASCVNGSTGYYDDQACVANAALCGDNALCGGTASYPYTPFCANFIITDAGGGG